MCQLVDCGKFRFDPGRNIPTFVCLFVCSFVPSFVRSFFCSFVRLFVRLFVCLLVCFFVYLFVWGYSSHYIRHHYRWRAAIFYLCSAVEGSLACHTCWDKGHPFLLVISEDPWRSHLAFRTGAVITRWDSNTQLSACGVNALTHWASAEVNILTAPLLRTHAAHIRQLFENPLILCHLKHYVYTGLSSFTITCQM